MGAALTFYFLRLSQENPYVFILEANRDIENSRIRREISEGENFSSILIPEQLCPLSHDFASHPDLFKASSRLVESIHKERHLPALKRKHPSMQLNFASSEILTQDICPMHLRDFPGERNKTTATREWVNLERLEYVNYSSRQHPSVQDSWR